MVLEEVWAVLLLLTSELLPVVESEYSPGRAAATAAAPAASSHGLRSDSNFPFLKQISAFDTIWRFFEVGTTADYSASHAGRRTFISTSRVVFASLLICGGLCPHSVHRIRSGAA